MATDMAGYSGAFGVALIYLTVSALRVAVLHRRGSRRGLIGRGGGRWKLS